MYSVIHIMVDTYKISLEFQFDGSISFIKPWPIVDYYKLHLTS